MPPSIIVPRHAALLSGGAIGAVVAGQLYLYGFGRDPIAAVGVPRNGRLKVPVWILADFHCPWSYLTKVSIDAAAAQFPELDVEVKWHPVILYTDLPWSGGPTRRQHVIKHGGGGPAGE
eukprot:Hpha_TRINITY_DN32833_c0_g1::TRINITY_DN32833_c0_g1_i1::g.87294::m.87294